MVDMNEKTYAAALSLRQALEEDPRLIALKEAEARLNQDERAVALSKEKEKLSEAYDEALLHFGEDSDITKEAWHRLYLKKKELDELPASKAYWEKYLPLAKLYRELDSLVFGEFREKRKCKEKL